MKVVKQIIKRLTKPEQRVKVKKWKRHLKEFFLHKKKMSINEFRRILVDELGRDWGKVSR